MEALDGFVDEDPVRTPGYSESSDSDTTSESEDADEAVVVQEQEQQQQQQRREGGADMVDVDVAVSDHPLGAAPEHATTEDIEDIEDIGSVVEKLQQLSAYQLRTYAVGSVLPMSCSSASTKILLGLSTLLEEAAPDQKVLSSLARGGFALRAVSWKTSGSYRVHKGIMQLAGEDKSTPGTAMVSTVDPTLDCFRSRKFLGLLRDTMNVTDISDVERITLIAATLCLVCKTPPHSSIAAGEWAEKTIDLISETRHLNGARIVVIPEDDKEALREKILNTHLMACIAVETDEVVLAQLNGSLDSNQKGWIDAGERERAMGLIDRSVVLMVGIRHSAAEKDNLMMDPHTLDVSCLNDVSRRNAVLRGVAPATLKVPLEMFTLHMAIVVAAAVRVVAKSQNQDRDDMMRSLFDEPPIFQQQDYLEKAKKATITKAAPVGKVDPVKKVKMGSWEERCARLADELASVRADFESRIKALEDFRDSSALKRSRAEIDGGATDVGDGEGEGEAEAEAEEASESL